MTTRVYGIVAFALAAVVWGTAPAAAQQQLAAAKSTFDAADECIDLDVRGMGTGAVETNGTWAGTIAWYVIGVGGTQHVVDMWPPSAPGTGVNSTTDVNGTWSGSVAGYRTLRACMTAYTSGSADVWLSAAPSSGGPVAGGASAAESSAYDPASDSLKSSFVDAAGDPLTPIESGTAYSTGLSTAAVIAGLIKGSAGLLLSLQCFNDGANEVFVRLYNHVDAPAAGDTADIVWRGMVPGNAAGAGFTTTFGPSGKAFATGMGIRVTAAVADNDNTSLTANEVVCNADYN